MKRETHETIAIPPLDSLLTDEERSLVSSHATAFDVTAGTILFDSTSCKGILWIVSGVVRVYMVSDEGREITLYRLQDGDLCPLSVSCLLGSMPLKALVSAETDTRVVTISNDAFARIHERNAAVQRLMLSTMTARLSDVMWVVDQVVFRGIDRRLAEYLLSQPSELVYATHEEIAAELGTAREVVSRMLKYFEKAGLVTLSRGRVRVVDAAGLRAGRA